MQIALDAAGGKNVEGVLPDHRSAAARELLIDEINLHIAPILLGDGIRLYDNPAGQPVRLHLIPDGDPALALNVRYRLVTTH